MVGAMPAIVVPIGPLILSQVSIWKSIGQAHLAVLHLRPGFCGAWNLTFKRLLGLVLAFCSAVKICGLDRSSLVHAIKPVMLSSSQAHPVTDPRNIDADGHPSRFFRSAKPQLNIVCKTQRCVRISTSTNQKARRETSRKMEPNRSRKNVYTHPLFTAVYRRSYRRVFIFCDI